RCSPGSSNDDESEFVGGILYQVADACRVEFGQCYRLGFPVGLDLLIPFVLPSPCYGTSERLGDRFGNRCASENCVYGIAKVFCVPGAGLFVGIDSACIAKFSVTIKYVCMRRC